MKKWYQSKTLWFNILTAAVAVIGQVTNTIPLSASAMKIFAVVLAVGNMLLRLITTTSIGTPPQQ